MDVESPPASGTTFRVYKTRWLTLAFFSWFTASNAVLYISFAPIKTSTMAFYGVSSVAVNWLSMIFMATYLPGTILATLCFQRWGFRRGILIAACLNALGAAVRCLSVEDNDSASENGFTVLFVGQTITSLAQPFALNAPAWLAMEWFSIKQRDMATTLASMCNPLGLALGNLLPVAFVSEGGSGMLVLLLVEAGMSVVALVLLLVHFPDRPPSPPSQSVKSRDVTLQNSTSFSETMSRVVREYRELFSNKHFLLLMFAFGYGLGIFNALTTLIETFVHPAGYTEDDAGLFGAVMIVSGLIGAGLAGAIMDKTHAYRRMLKALAVCALLGTFFLGQALRPGKAALVAVAWGVMGACMLPLLPVSFENAAECTYPIPEESSSGLLMLSGQVFGIACIHILEPLIELEPRFTTVWTPTFIFLLATMVCIAITLLFYQGRYKRLEADTDVKGLVPSSETGSASSPPYVHYQSDS